LDGNINNLKRGKDATSIYSTPTGVPLGMAPPAGESKGT